MKKLISFLVAGLFLITLNLNAQEETKQTKKEKNKTEKSTCKKEKKEKKSCCKSKNTESKS